MHLLRNKLVKSDFFSFSLPQATAERAVAYVCTTNYHKLILMQATAERAISSGFRRNSDSELKLKNRCTGSTSPSRQKKWHTTVKTLPYPKLRLRAVNITSTNGKIGRTKFVTQSSSQQEFVRPALDPASNQFGFNEQPDFFTLKSLAAMLMLMCLALMLPNNNFLPVKTPNKTLMDCAWSTQDVCQPRI